ncbi:hypothetical protein WJX73_004128 [Symbiochloris irregularis]|uniref:Uncharacterized protein n=1 Tax=Symbiochloris irregularis TaxID=706552 RepID=A0AAW1NW58_9CHLO
MAVKTSRHWEKDLELAWGSLHSAIPASWQLLGCETCNLEDSWKSAGTGVCFVPAEMTNFATAATYPQRDDYEDVHAADKERIFNLSGAPRQQLTSSPPKQQLASYPIESFKERRQSSGREEDQIGAYNPGQLGGFQPPAEGWVVFEKHRNQKIPVKVSKPGGSKSGTLQKLEAERDQIRQQQAQRAAERKAAEEEAAEAKKQEQLQARREQVEQKRLARLAATARHQELTAKREEYVQALMADRTTPLHQRFEEDFKAKERAHRQETVQKYNHTVRPFKTQTARSIIAGEKIEAPPLPPKSPVQRPGSKGKSAAKLAKSLPAKLSSKPSGTVQSLTGSVDRGCSPMVFSKPDELAADQVAEPSYVTEEGEVFEVLKERRQSQSMLESRTSAAFASAREAHEHSTDQGGEEGQGGQPQDAEAAWEIVQTSRQVSEDHDGAKPAAGNGLDDNVGLQAQSSSFSPDDNIGRLARGLSRLLLVRQTSDERDDNHALSLTKEPSTEAGNDPSVPDTFFVEDNELGSRNSLQRVTSNMGDPEVEEYDPDPPLDFGPPESEEDDAFQPDPLAQQTSRLGLVPEERSATFSEDESEQQAHAEVQFEHEGDVHREPQAHDDVLISHVFSKAEDDGLLGPRKSSEAE